VVDRQKAVTTFRSADERAATKRDEAMVREEQAWDNEGGHIGSTVPRRRFPADFEQRQ
jgi:hypothetical protein